MSAAQQRAAAQAAARVSTQVQEFEPEVPATQTPTIAQVAVAQGQNIANLRTLLEDLAKGVIELSKVVGTHTKAVEDLRLRIDSIEQELGVEIDPEAVDGDLAATEDDAELGPSTDNIELGGDLGDGGEFVDGDGEYYDEQALPAEGYDDTGDVYDDDQYADPPAEEAA
jgi:hypothetical protein